MKNKLLGKHKETIKAIALRYGVRSIRVFGSFAKGEEDVNSDIDFLVELDPKRSLLDIISLKHEIEDVTGRKVTIVTKAAVSPYLIDQITKEAVRL